jgi:hypothetical protein
VTRGGNEGDVTIHIGIVGRDGVPRVKDSRDDDEDNHDRAEHSERDPQPTASIRDASCRLRLSREIRGLIARRKFGFFGGGCHAFITADHTILPPCQPFLLLNFYFRLSTS